MTAVILGKTQSTINRLMGSKILGNEIPKPWPGAGIAPKEDRPSFRGCHDPDVPGVAFAATAGTAGDPDLDLCRERLVFELYHRLPGQPDRVLFAIPAHIGAKTGLDELDTRCSLGFCERTRDQR